MTEETVELVKTTTAWTDEELRTAITMWEAKAASPDIAVLVNKTRNAVIGKMNRLGHKWGAALIPEGTEAPVEASTEDPKEPEPEPAPPPSTPVHEPERPSPVHTPEPRQIPVTAERKPVHFLAATSFQCKFPLFKGPEPIEQKFVCGAPVQGITSWCEVHHAIVFEPMRARKR